MRSLFLTIVLCLLVPQLARAGADCQNVGSRYEDIACASAAFDAADKELNKLYRETLALHDEDGQKKLRASQRAWIDFRDADTHFRYHNSGEGGSLGGLIALNHKLDLTLLRIAQLKNFKHSKGG